MVIGVARADSEFRAHAWLDVEAPVAGCRLPRDHTYRAVTICPTPFEFDDLELACGLVFGGRPAPEAEPDEYRTVEPLRALEEAILPLLQRPPCVVSFSGGRDSSAVLAVAVTLARREGLPLPIPASNVFPDGSTANESAWQERVVRHLGLGDWVRIDSGGDLDCLGPIAVGALRRHGLLWPFNAYFHIPLFEVARGGVLLTGIGGDELLGTSQWARAAAVISGSARPVPRDFLRVGVALAPASVRRRALRRLAPAPFSWLTAEAGQRFVRTWSMEVAGEPLRWSDRWSWWRGRRSVVAGLRSLELLSGDHDVIVSHPLADRQFARSAGRAAGRRRIFERTELLRVLFGKLLPAEIIERQSKAFFDEVFWGKHSRAFVEQALEVLADVRAPAVDRHALRSAWEQETPDAHSLFLLQALSLRAAVGAGSGALPVWPSGQ